MQSIYRHDMSCYYLTMRFTFLIIILVYLTGLSAISQQVWRRLSPNKKANPKAYAKQSNSKRRVNRCKSMTEVKYHCGSHMELQYETKAGKKKRHSRWFDASKVPLFTSSNI